MHGRRLGAIVEYHSSVTKDEGVYECRIGTSNESLCIMSARRRTDKVLPNKLPVAENVVSILNSNRNIYTMFVRHLTSLSFGARECLHTLVMNMRSTGCLIIDIGSGKGQALSIMNFDTCSYHFCNHEQSLRRLTRSVVDLTNFDSESICNWMSRVNKFPGLIGAYRGKIESLLTDNVLRRQCSSKVPLMLMFSLSHVHDKLLEIAR